MLAEFFRARIRIVVGAVPVDRSVLGNHFVAAVARHGDGGNLAEAAQAVRVLRAASELRDFQRAAQIHVEAAFFGFAVERSRAMNHRLGRADQVRVVGRVQPKTRIGEISAKNGNARFERIAELRKVQMQLQRVPEALVRLLLRLRAHQQIQAVRVTLQQEGGDVRADVAGGTGQKDGHGLVLGPRAGRRPRMRQIFRGVPLHCRRAARKKRGADALPSGALR